MLSSLLFDVFFASILLVALERFSEDVDIVADLAHLEQPSNTGPETVLGCARRAILWMLCADDACMMSRLPRGLERMMAVFVEVLRRFWPDLFKRARRKPCAYPFRLRWQRR